MKQVSHTSAHMRMCGTMTIHNASVARVHFGPGLYFIPTSAIPLLINYNNIARAFIIQRMREESER